MMRVKVTARRLTGDMNAIMCKRCDNRVILPKNPYFIMYDDGARMFVRDPTDGSLRHRCGTELEWRCNNCKRVSEPQLIPIEKRGKMTRHKINLECQLCEEGRLIQREATSARY